MHIFCSPSVSSVVVRSTSITWTSLRRVSLGCVGDILIETGTLSSVAASSLRVLLGGVLDSPPISCQKESSLLSASFCCSSDNSLSYSIHLVQFTAINQLSIVVLNSKIVC